MILNNFYNWRKNVLQYCIQDNAGVIKTENSYAIKDTLGDNQDYFSNPTFLNDCSGYFKMSVDSNNSGLPIESNGSKISYVNGVSIHIGSGNTTPTTDDYVLENPYIPNTDYKFISSEIIKKIEDNKFIFTFNNFFTAINSLSVKESCITSGFQCKTNSGSGTTTTRLAMLTRNVLNTPLEVTAGESFTVTETIEIPLD